MTGTDTAPGTGLTPQQVQLLLSPLHFGRVRELNGNSHLEAWDVRRWLTRIFGFTGWSDEILSCELVHEQFWPVMDKGKPVPGKNRCTAVYRVTLRLTVKDAHGNVLGFWDDAATGDAVNQASVGDAHDLALKTAVSQALKRCAVNLGDQFGLSLYNKGSIAPVVLRLATLTSGSETQLDDAPVEGGELDEPREGAGEPQTQVAEAVARKARREARTQPPADDEFAPAQLDKASDAMLRNLNMALKERGFTTDDARHAEVSRIVGRPITSTSQLSPGEARHVLRSLAGTPQNPAPNPRNGNTLPSPAVAAALGTPTLDKLLARAKGEDGKSVPVQLRELLESAWTGEHVDLAGKLAVEARDQGHLTPDDFDQLAPIASARREQIGAADPAQAPTAEQYDVRDRFEKRIKRAKTVAECEDVAGALVESRDAARITPVQYAALVRMLDERFATIRQQAGQPPEGEGSWSHRLLGETTGTAP
jgi:hypothetical protein